MRIVSHEDYENESVPGHYLIEMSVENVRCFGKRQSLKLADDAGRPHHWTIILGDNGTGKTSLLKSIVALAPSPKQVFGREQKLRLYPGLLDWRHAWDTSRYGAGAPAHFACTITSGRSLREAQRGRRQELRVDDGHSGTDGIEYDPAAYAGLGDFLCFAYGASRRMGSPRLGSDKIATASVSLFDDDAPLVNVEEFFLQADYEAKTSRSAKAHQQRETVRRLLVDILPDVQDLRITRTKSRADSGRLVEALTPFGWVRVAEMSLGYKSLIAWLVDFASRMYHYHRTKPEPFKEPAVVLVDEIDLHLHPRWQRRILGHLSRKFPNTQFIATAHSPLVVQSALGANLVLLKRRGSQVLIKNEPEVIATWRIDQILTSDMFGVSSSRSESVERMLKERRQLLSKPRMTSGDTTKLQGIESELGRIPVAETPEGIRAMQIIERAAEEISPGG